MQDPKTQRIIDAILSQRDQALAQVVALIVQLQEANDKIKELEVKSGVLQ